MAQISLENIKDLWKGHGFFMEDFTWADGYEIARYYMTDEAIYVLYVNSETDWFILKYAWYGGTRFYKEDSKDWTDINVTWLAAVMGFPYPYDYYYNIF